MCFSQMDKKQNHGTLKDYIISSQVINREKRENNLCRRKMPSLAPPQGLTPECSMITLRELTAHFDVKIKLLHFQDNICVITPCNLTTDHCN